MFSLPTQTDTIGWTSNMAPTTTGNVTRHVYFVPRMSNSLSEEWSSRARTHEAAGRTA